MAMRKQFLVALAVAGLGFWTSGVSVRADEVTTTTTTRTEAPAEPGVTVGVPGVVGVHIGGDARPEGCVTHKETHTDTETGDSVTRKSTDCN
jgi:hypothetical protein